ncbi:MAG TPA: hypothetical protein VIK61_07730 [Acidimicrobiia bacterium]
MNRGRRLLLVLTVAAGLGAAGAIGWAYFSAPGSGSATVGVTSLSAPSGVTVPAAVVGTTVHVSWTGVSAPGGSSTVGYWVRRYSGTTPTDACGSSHASPITAGTGAKSCDDTSVASGTYTYTVTAVFHSWTAASSASSSVTVATLDHFTVTAPSSTTAGTAFSVTVSARDASNTTLAAYTGTVHFSTTDVNAPALPSNYTFVAGDNGTHVFSSAVTLKTAGSQALSVNDTAQTAKTGTSGSITVAGTALDHFTVTAPASATAGAAFSSAAVAAQDVYGNPAAGWTSATQCVTFSGPANAPNGTAPNYPAVGSCGAGQSSLSFNTSGLASSIGITLYKAQSVALTATATSKTGTSAAIAVGAGPAAGFLASAPASATAGTQFAVPSLTARDAYSNTATSYTGSHTLAWSGPGDAPNGATPTLPATAVSFTAGVSTTSLNATLVKAESATLTASETSGPSGSASITVNPATASNFLVTAPANATAGTAFTVTSLTARDTFNNTATAYTGAHTITWSGPTNALDGVGPTLPATSVAFTNGVSTTALGATLVKAETATLTAKEGTTPSGSATTTVSAGTASKLAWTNPTSASGSVSGLCLFTCTWNTIGRGNTWTAKVSVTDTHGNIVSAVGSGHTVTFSAAVGGVSPTSLSFPAAGAATTATAVTFTSLGSNGWTTDTLTATSSPFANATATFNK